MPGAKGHPFFGHALLLINPEDTLQKLIDWKKIHGSRLKVILGYFAYHFFLTDPKDIEKVVNSHTLIEKGISYNFLLPWL
ncbi:unnamed protein product, partial [Allacma fusca]